MKLTGTGIPQVVDLAADATGVGKSLGALRLRHHFDQHGVKNTLVSIESRAVTPRGHRNGDIVIFTEDFRRAKEMPGGFAGILRPYYLAIERAAKTGSAVIGDWAGGHAQSRLEALTATQHDQGLASFGVVGLSVEATTNAATRMQQAAENLNKLRELVPGLRRAVLLNERAGSFDFIPGTAPARAYAELRKAAQDAAIIQFPAITGESWQICEQAGLSIPAVIGATPGHIAARTGLDTFTATACRSEIHAWWELTQSALDQVFPFRSKPGAGV